MNKSDSNPKIDQETVRNLRGLRTVTGGSLFEQVAQVYFSEIPYQISDLLKAVESNDFLEIEKVAHKLKGSFGNIGFKVLFEDCKKLEEAARQNQEIDYKLWYQSIAKDVEQSIEVLLVELEKG